MAGLAACLAGGLWAAGIAATPLKVVVPGLYHTEPIGEIFGPQSAGQTFRAPYNHLTAVAVSLTDYGRRNTGPVEFILKAAPDAAQPLAAQTLPAAAIHGDTFQRFEFEPIDESAGREFYFELSAPQGGPGNAITAYYQPDDAYQEGQAYWQTEPRAGDLVFTLYFRPTAGERLAIFLQQVTAGKPGLWGETGWLLALGLAYLVLAGGLWALSGAAAGSDRDDPPSA